MPFDTSASITSRVTVWPGACRSSSRIATSDHIKGRLTSVPSKSHQRAPREGMSGRHHTVGGLGAVGWFGGLDQHYLVAGGAPPPPARVGPHPHAKSGPPARRYLAASGLLGSAVRSNMQPENADPSG